MQKVKTSDLQVGMYVDLGSGWLNHPFLRRSFLLKKESQISKISSYLKHVSVCPDRSKTELPERQETKSVEPPVLEEAIIGTEVEQVTEPPPNPCNENWIEKNQPSEKLAETIQSNKPAAEKAQAIFHHSTDLMESVLSQAPTAELIHESSETIKNLAGFIVEDDEVSNKLLAITSHDYYTYTHSVNVGLKCLLIAKKLLKTSDTELMKELGVGFFLHDIGKSQVDPNILNKPGKLSDEEFEIMKSHPQRGVELLRLADSLTESARVITEQHHEKVDGSGYPYGLKGKQVHEFGQICALGDIYDALTSERSYKSGMTPYEALLLMKEKMTGHFDEKLFNEFLYLFAEESQKLLDEQKLIV